MWDIIKLCIIYKKLNLSSKDKTCKIWRDENFDVSEKEKETIKEKKI